MMMKKNKSFGFSLIEVMMCVVILAFITMLTFKYMGNAAPKVDNAKFKNAYLSLVHAVNSLLINPSYYSDESGFYDLNEVVFDNTTTLVLYKDDYKFRNLLLRELGTTGITNSLDCYMLVGGEKQGASNPTNKKLCYKSDNNVVWGIPDTNFDNQGTMRIAGQSGELKYVPVTFYIDHTKTNTVDGFQRNAVVIGIRADGDTKFINTVDCSNEKYKDFVQCRAEDMFASLKNIDRK